MFWNFRSQNKPIFLNFDFYNVTHFERISEFLQIFNLRPKPVFLNFDFSNLTKLSRYIVASIRPDYPTRSSSNANCQRCKFSGKRSNVKKLDLREAYHQLVLHSNNRHITKFTAHERLFRFKRLNYGFNTAGKLFQHVVQEKLSGIKDVVHGKTCAIYDEALDCLKRFQQVNFKLKPEKCQFLQESM